jgi:hypothetical protein
MKDTRSGYAVDPAAGEGLLSAIDVQLGRVDEWLGRIRSLARPLPLGQNPVGVAMSDKLARVTAGGPGSFAAALDAYRAELEAARDAVARSFETYGSHDERHAHEFLADVEV